MFTLHELLLKKAKCNEQNYLLSVNQINLYNFLQQDSDGIEK